MKYVGLFQVTSLITIETTMSTLLVQATTSISSVKNYHIRKIADTKMGEFSARFRGEGGPLQIFLYIEVIIGDHETMPTAQT